MLVARRVCRCYSPQSVLHRGLRKLRKSGENVPKQEEFEELQGQGNSVAYEAHISALQIPLMEHELQNLASKKPILKSYPQEKKKLTLKERVKPDVNPPIVEPIIAENQHERLEQVVTPLCQVPYGKQLQLKHRNTSDILKYLSKRLTDVQAPFEKIKGGLPCLLEPIRPSPELLGYRNRDTFGISNGVDGNPKTVGLFVGKSRDPLMTSVPPTYIINVKKSHKHIVQRFQTFIRQSQYDACHDSVTGGIWRNLMVRSTRADERMATVFIHPQGLIEDEILEIMENLERFFFHGEGADCELDSLYLQACRLTTCTREMAPYRLIRGKKSIIETCDGLSFHISPDSFFQINTGGAEVLYKTVREVAEVSPLTTLLDIGCGTGAISLIMAPYVRWALGIETISGAVDDANENIKINEVSNASFIKGDITKVLPNIIRELSQCTDVVAILNPGRAGLNKKVIGSIRQCEAISKLVYISCDPGEKAMADFVQLASMKKSKGQKRENTIPFVPKYAIPIDILPHTHHTELVILFERAVH